MYGVNVKLKIDNTDAAVKSLNAQIQSTFKKAVRLESLPKIRLEIDRSEKAISDLQSSIKRSIHTATKAAEKGGASPIQISNISFHITKKAMDDVASQLRSRPVELKIASIDAAPAVDRLRKQLTTMLSGLEIGGLKEFIGDNATSDALERAANATERHAKAMENLQANARAAKASMTELQALQRSLNSKYGTVLGIQDKSKNDDYYKRYQSLQKQILEASKLSGEAQAREIQRIRDGIIGLNIEIENYVERMNDAKKHADTIEKVRKDLEKYYRGADKIADNQKADSVRAQYEDLTRSINAAADSEISSNAETVASLREKAEAINDVIKKLLEEKEAARDVEKASKAAAKRSNRAITLAGQIDSYKGLNPHAAKGFSSEFKKMADALNNVQEVTDESLDDIAKRFKIVKQLAKELGFEGKNAFEQITSGGSEALSVITNFAAAHFSLRQLEKVLREVWSAVKDLDLALTELKKVTDLTDAAYDRFLRSAASMSSRVGSTLSSVVTATADFARLGYSITDAARLAEASLLYKNVGDGIESVSQSSESLISTIKAFGVDVSNVTHIVDAFNEVGNNFAISSTGIGEALKRSAAALATSGNSLEESIGLITAMNSIVQDPEVVGTALKTLTMYLRAAKTEAEEAGIATDGMASSVSKLRDDLLALTGNKVDIMLNEDTFKSTFQIIKELSEVWDTLTDITQANILQKIAGKRNANVVTSLIKNFEDAEAAAASAMDSTGSAILENEKYLDSINGKLTMMRSQFEQISTEVLDSNVVKFFLDITLAIEKVVVSLAKAKSLIPTLLVAKTFFSGFKNRLKQKERVRNVLDMFSAESEKIGKLRLAYKALSDAEKKYFEDVAVNSRTLSVETINAIKTVTGLDVAQKKAAGGAAAHAAALSGLKGVMASFKATLLADPIGLAITSISVLISLLSIAADGYKSFHDARIDAGKRVHDDFEEAKSSYKSNMDTLDGVKNRFIELSRGVDEAGNNLTLTNEEYKEFLGIIDQIIGVSPSIVTGYDSQGKAVLDYKDALKDAIDEQEHFNKISQIEYYNSGDSIFKGAKTQYKSLLSEYEKAYRQFQTEIAGSWSPGDIRTWNQIIYSDKYGTDSGPFGDLQTIHDHADEILADAKELGKYSEEQISAMEKGMQSMYTYYYRLESITGETVSFLMDKMLRDVDNIESPLHNIPLEAMDEFKDGLRSVVDVTKSFEKNESMAISYATEFAQYFKDDKVSEILNMAGGIQVGSESIEDYNAAVLDWANGIEDTTPAFYAFVEFLKSLATTADQAGESLYHLSQNPFIVNDRMQAALSQYESNAKIAQTAKQEMDSSSGSISSSTFNSVLGAMEDGESVADYIYTENGALKLNIDAWMARNAEIRQAPIDSMQNHVDALNKENTLLGSIIDQNGQVNRQGIENFISADKFIKSNVDLIKRLEGVEDPLKIAQESWGASFFGAPLKMFTAGNTGDGYGIPYSDNLVFHLTPVLEDGTVLTPDGLSEYAKDLVSRAVEKGIDIQSADLSENGGKNLLVDWSPSIGNIDDDIAHGQILVSGFNEMQRALYDGSYDVLSRGKEITGVITRNIADIEKYTNTIDIFETSMLSIGNSNPLLESNSVMDKLDKMTSRTSEISKAMNTLRSGGSLTADAINELITSSSDFRSVIENGSFDLSSPEGQMEALGETIHMVQNEYHGLIDSHLVALREMRNSAEAKGNNDLVQQIDRSIAVFEFLNSIDQDGMNRMFGVSAVSDMAAAFDNLKTAANVLGSIRNEMAATGEVSVDTLFSLQKILGDKATGLFSIDNGKITVDIEALSGAMSDYYDSSLAATGATEEMRSVIIGYLKDVIPAQLATDKLASSMKELSSGQSLLERARKEFDDNGSLSLDTLVAVKQLLGDRFDFDTYFADSAAGINYAEAAIHDYCVSVIDGLEGIPDAAKNAAKAELDMANSSVSSFQKLNTLLDTVMKASSAIKSARDEIAQTGKSSLETISSIRNMIGETDWSDEKFLTDGVLNIESLRDYYFTAIQASDANDFYKMSMMGLLDISDEQVSVNDRLSASYSNMLSIIEKASDANSRMELTYEAYQKLIDVDKRYASAVEYRNGIMVLNSQRYSEITNSILQEQLALAEARVMEIELSEEYQNLISNVDNLDSKQRERLDSLNAEIAGYGVLAVEIDNAASSLNNFLNASTESDSTRYGAAIDMLKVIKDTLYDTESDLYGKIGRDQYKQAVKFLISPDIDTNSPEWENAYKKIESWITEGSEGVNTFVHDITVAGFVDPATGVINSTISEIANALGTTEDVIRTMFDQYNLYAETPIEITLEESDNLKDTTDKLDDLQDTSIDIDAKKAESTLTNVSDKADSIDESIKDVRSSISEINDMHVDVDTTMVIRKLAGVSDALKRIADKLSDIAKMSPIDIQINETTVAATSKNPFSNILGGIFGRKKGHAAVSGTHSSLPGRTLVGEVGPEAYVDPSTNTWHLVGEHGPEFITLPANAIVFDAKQTEDLFSKGRTETEGRALVSGNAAASGLVSSVVDTIKKATNNIVNGVINTVKGSIAYVSGDRVNGSISTVPSGNKKPGKHGSGSSSHGREDVEEELSELEKLREKYEEINSYTEHLIAHQEHLFKEAKNGLDFPGMSDSLNEQIKLYKQLMEDSQKAVADMLSSGGTDRDKEVQAMEEVYWKAYDSLNSKLEELSRLHTDALHDKIDSIQSAYGDLRKAADEYNSQGGISMDTFQSLLKHGSQYLSFLDNINGKYVINEDGIKRVIEAEKNQLAVETALSYIAQLRQALGDKDADRLNNLVDLSNKVSGSTWDMVFAQAELLKGLGLTGDQYQTVINNINAIKDISNNVISDITSGSNDTSNGYKGQQAALDSILNYVQDLIRYETKERVEAIEKQVDEYKKIVDLKKESLKTTKEENDYNKQVADKVKEIADIQSRIDQLSLDDSREAAAERAKLTEELNKLQEDLNDKQSDHILDMQTDALDKQAEDYEESRQQEIEDLNNSISSAEKLYQLALKRIETGMSTLYEELIAWNTEAGSVLNKEITENWNKALEAVKKYGSFAAAVSQLKILTDQDGHNIIVADATKIPKFHTGGAVGSHTSAKDKETLALLQDDELVLNDKMKKSLFSVIDFKDELSRRLGKVLKTIDLMPSLDTSISSSVAATPTPLVSDGFASNVFSPVINVEITGAGDTTSSQAEKFAKEIADSTIDRLHEAFGRIGVGGNIRKNLR